MARAFLGLGSNLDNRLFYLRRAVKEISQIARVSEISSVYETEPVGFIDQPAFLNAVLEVETGDSPEILLHRLKGIEKLVGRKTAVHLREREIDIDILLFDSLKLSTAAVTVPHPELHNRRFVLVPLSEVAADVEHPILQKSVSALLVDCSDRSRVEKTRYVLQTAVKPQVEKVP
jgi:2-amino-4-hydroxy-6-hydroxymethyldihydropteridine diphosphokinase